MDDKQSLELDRLEKSVRELLAKGRKSEARDLAETYFEFRPANAAELSRAATVFRDVGLSGTAQVMIERYRALHPDDKRAHLIFIESRIQTGLKSEAVALLIKDLRLETLDDHLYLAKSLSRAGFAGLATLTYERSLEKFSSSIAAWRGLIENYNRKERYKEARRAVKKLISLTTRDAKSEQWAFLAEHAAAAGEWNVFAAAAKQAEAVLSLEETDIPPRLMLARAYGQRHDRSAVTRLIGAIRINDISSETILSEILDLAERMNLVEFLVPVAQRVLEISEQPSALKTRCDTIVATQKSFTPYALMWNGVISPR